MYRLFAAVLIVLVVSNAAAFTTGSTTLGATRVGPSTSGMPVAFSTTSTSLNLKVKIDPNAKEERVNPAVFKNALYLGSIAFAVLLPVALLIAGSK